MEASDPPQSRVDRPSSLKEAAFEAAFLVGHEHLEQCRCLIDDLRGSRTAAAHSSPL